MKPQRPLPRSDWELSYKPRIPTAEEWDEKRVIFTKLYHNNSSACRPTLTEVRKIMAENHGFYANENQYKYKIREWKLTRYLGKEAASTMLLIKDYRAREGKSTVFKYNGVVVEDHKLERSRKRYKLTSGPKFSIPEVIPSPVEFSTPSPQSDKEMSEMLEEDENAVDDALGGINNHEDRDTGVILEGDDTQNNSTPSGINYHNLSTLRGVPAEDNTRGGSNEMGGVQVLLCSFCGHMPFETNKRNVPEEFHYQMDNCPGPLPTQAEEVNFLGQRIWPGDLHRKNDLVVLVDQLVGVIGGTDIRGEDESPLKVKEQGLKEISMEDADEWISDIVEELAGRIGGTDIWDGDESPPKAKEQEPKDFIEDVDDLLKNLYLGRKSGALEIMGITSGWEQIEPEIKNKNNMMRMRGSVWMSSGWGGASVIDSWIKDDVVTKGTLFGSDSYSVCTRDNHDQRDRGEDKGPSNLPTGPQFKVNLDSTPTFGRRLFGSDEELGWTSKSRRKGLRSLNGSYRPLDPELFTYMGLNYSIDIS